MSILTRNELLSANKRRYAVVSIPTGGECRLQSLTAGEMRTFRSSLTDAAGEMRADRAERLQELLIAKTLVDENCNREFSDDDALCGVFDDLDGAVLAAIYRAARLHSGFAADADFAEVEAAVKNSLNGRESAEHES